MYDSDMMKVTNKSVLKVRKATKDGEHFLVAPVVMLVEGVHNGNNGPILYTQDTLKKFVEEWNGCPIYLDHPTSNGDYISSDDPRNKKPKLGYVSGAHVNGKLSAEAWLNVSALQEHAPTVLGDIKQGKRVEVSTGFLGDFKPVAGDWNGEPYNAVVDTMQPDHLAVLMDSPGACSIKDGCGLMANKPIENQLFLKRFATNELSQGERWDALCRALTASRGMSVYLVDVYDGFVVYQDGTRYYKQSYSMAENEMPVLADDSVEVSRKITYATADGVVVNRDKEKNMPEPVTVNCAQTEKEKGTANATEEPVVKPEPVKTPPTLDEYIANAPGPIREVLRSGMSMLERERKQLIGVITANAKNQFAKDKLEGMDLDTLRSIASFAAPEPVTQDRGTTNYGGLTDVVDNAEDDGEPVLELPKMTFAKKGV